MLVKQKRNKNGYYFVEKRNKIRYYFLEKGNKIGIYQTQNLFFNLKALKNAVLRKSKGRRFSFCR